MCGDVVRLRGRGRYDRHKEAKIDVRRYERGKRLVVVMIEEDRKRGLMLDLMLETLDDMAVSLHRGELGVVSTQIDVLRRRVETVKGLQPL